MPDTYHGFPTLKYFSKTYFCVVTKYFMTDDDLMLFIREHRSEIAHIERVYYPCSTYNSH